MTPIYRLHYAPDNASLIIRLALEELDQPFETVLVDRRGGALDSPGYRALNPQGLIPVLETPDGPMFETAAILLWLGDRHGSVLPDATSRDRAWCLKWLFFLSNTLHADLRILFYPKKYMGPDPARQEDLRQGVTARLVTHLATIEAAAENTPWLAGDRPSALDLYLACMMRWMALYPEGRDRSWFDLDATPRLKDMLTRLEQRPSVALAQAAEGLGDTPFTQPVYANPPEGSAT
ncbi:glutathione S-transferase family protein [Phaeobacter sp. PT47_59]|uniref:glutathione S-transferase family protein n=1 Tax=Phaeobacter sp. PT47_59 TaxID=3029979 RepID=UPI0023801C47|nr:glutathione S-transferase family protein [Phaeobacter sp. PT47_59]MDE4173467.1 glutathione S-transferase family protein [Phaeobacter sp. PT47_59]